MDTSSSAIVTVAESCTWAAQNLRNFWIPAAVAGVGGLIGGWAEFVTHVKIAKGKIRYDDEDITPEHLKFLRSHSLIVGFAGAWATLFVFVITRWWETEIQQPSLPLFILTLSVAGGFGARRLLPQLADKLKQQIEQTNIKVQEVEQMADSAKDVASDAKRQSERTAMLSRARATVATPGAAMGDVFTAAEELRNLFKQNPLDREVLIPLGNLLAKANQIDGAIETLTGFIDAKRSAGQLDNDLADVLFNRACYFVRKWQEMKNPNPEAADKRRVKAIADLKDSFAIKLSNIEDAEQDDDLAPLRVDSDYQAMLASTTTKKA